MMGYDFLCIVRWFRCDDVNLSMFTELLKHFRNVRIDFAFKKTDGRIIVSEIIDCTSYSFSIMFGIVIEYKRS